MAEAPVTRGCDNLSSTGGPGPLAAGLPIIPMLAEQPAACSRRPRDPPRPFWGCPPRPSLGSRFLAPRVRVWRQNRHFGLAHSGHVRRRDSFVNHQSASCNCSSPPDAGRESQLSWPEASMAVVMPDRVRLRGPRCGSAQFTKGTGVMKSWELMGTSLLMGVVVVALGAGLDAFVGRLNCCHATLDARWSGIRLFATTARSTAIGASPSRTARTAAIPTATGSLPEATGAPASGSRSARSCGPR